VLDLRLLDKVTFRMAVCGGTLFRLGFGALPFLLPLLFQLGFGLSAAHSGAITFVSAAGSMMMKGMTVRILRRWGYRRVMIWNAGICAALLALCGLFRPTWPIAVIYVALFVGGLFRSLQYNAFGSIAYAEVDHAEMSAATTFNMAMQQTSATLGIAVAAAVLNSTTLLLGHSAPMLSDFMIAFFVVALISLLPLPLSLALSEDAGAELTGRPRRTASQGSSGRRDETKDHATLSPGVSSRVDAGRRG
jgi:MFS family permease